MARTFHEIQQYNERRTSTQFFDDTPFFLFSFVCLFATLIQCPFILIFCTFLLVFFVSTEFCLLFILLQQKPESVEFCGVCMFSVVYTFIHRMIRYLFPLIWIRCIDNAFHCASLFCLFIFFFCYFLLSSWLSSLLERLFLPFILSS